MALSVDPYFATANADYISFVIINSLNTIYSFNNLQSFPFGCILKMEYTTVGKGGFSDG